jgi:hypothetical protein
MPIKMNPELAQLHDLMQKHRLTGRLYRNGDAVPLRQCSCGSWYFQTAPEDITKPFCPLFGAGVAAKYIAICPTLMPYMAAYWRLRLPDLGYSKRKHPWSEVLIGLQELRKAHPNE